MTKLSKEKVRRAVGSPLDGRVRPAVDEGALAEATAAAWKRHAQRVHYQWPMGCGSHAALQTPEILAEQGFALAVREIVFQLTARPAGHERDDCAN